MTDKSSASFFHYEDGVEDARPIEVESVHIERVFRYEIGIGVYNSQGLKRLVLYREDGND